MINILLWWLTSVIIGVGFMPLTSRLFSKFRDGGWMFSRSLGIFISGYVYWVLSCIKVLKFTSLNCTLVLCACIMVNVAAGFFLYKKDGKKPEVSLKLILMEEILFLAFYLFWCYVISFSPEAYGTEKFMDYGFMTSMMRAEYLPPADPWYAGETINYYYGGQYLAVFLTKITGVPVGEACNLMRALIAGFAFVMPFSIVYQLVDRLQIHKRKSVSTKWCCFGGILAGLALSFCGNMHYVIYALIVPMIEKFTGTQINDYYYPNSTRYIGHNPVVEGDNTIHEFPSYSFVVGDLHAHMVNIMFVLVVVGVALAWALKMEKRKSELKLKEALLQPEVLLIGFLTGMFRWTNFWDFPIYFVVGGSVVFFMNIRLYKHSIKEFLVTTIGQAVEVLVVGTIACLPFTMDFDKIASNIKLAHTHSAFYQLVILWGLPAVIVITFLVRCVRCYLNGCKEQSRFNGQRAKKNQNTQNNSKKPNSKAQDIKTQNAKNSNVESKQMTESELAGQKKPSLVGFFVQISAEDLFIFLMGLCALGLILMPEVLYVEDIYTTAPRANTMFKLTYQAYMLFAICMGYVLTKGLMLGKKAVYSASWVGFICLVMTAGFGFNAINSQYGDITDASGMKGMDASIYVFESFESDYEAINWMNENISGQPVILEANGDSYSGYERVSVATGLPTVMGWYVHEWLWRNDTAAQNVRSADIKTIYTSSDKKEVEELIEKYNISYIYIGNLEREKFPELNDTLLQEMGSVAYSNGTDTYIMKVR